MTLLYVSIGGNKKQLYYSIPIELPYGRNSNFLGRDEQLDQIHQALRGSPRNSFIKEVLHGTGGMGKTQIALEYAYRYQAEYSSIFWVNGTSIQTTTRDFYNIAQRIVDHHVFMQKKPIPDYPQISHELGMTGLVDASGKVSAESDAESKVVGAIKHWLSNEQNNNWLLVFDNVDDIEGFDISNFFPHSSKRGCTIITSRRQDLAFGEVSQCIEGLDEENAISLLLSSAKKESLNGKSSLPIKIILSS